MHNRLQNSILTCKAIQRYQQSLTTITLVQTLDVDTKRRCCMCPLTKIPSALIVSGCSSANPHNLSRPNLCLLIMSHAQVHFTTADLSNRNYEAYGKHLEDCLAYRWWDCQLTRKRGVSKNCTALQNFKLPGFQCGGRLRYVSWQSSAICRYN